MWIRKSVRRQSIPHTAEAPCLLPWDTMLLGLVRLKLDDIKKRNNEVGASYAHWCAHREPSLVAPLMIGSARGRVGQWGGEGVKGGRTDALRSGLFRTVVIGETCQRMGGRRGALPSLWCTNKGHVFSGIAGRQKGHKMICVNFVLIIMGATC